MWISYTGGTSGELRKGQVEYVIENDEIEVKIAHGHLSAHHTKYCLLLPVPIHALFLLWERKLTIA